MEARLFRKFDETGDPLLDAHRVVGARMRGRPVDPTDDEARQHGKTVHMALNYGATVRVWREHVPDDPRSDEEIMVQEVKKFRRMHPAQTQLMYNLNKQALRCVRYRIPVRCKRYSFEMDGDTLILRLSSGRPLFYPKAHIKRGKFNKNVVAYHNPAKNRGDEMWYGAWLAHLVSATSRDLLVSALFNLDTAGFNIILHVHDEIIAEIDPENVEHDRERFNACMLAAPAWAEALPFAAKVRVSERYIKAETPIEVTTQIEPLQPQVGFLEVTKIPSETNKRTGELPIGSESERNLVNAEIDPNGDDPADDDESPPWSPTPVHVASIPFMITRMMKEQLHAQGFSEQQIFEMTPQRAHELLGIEPVRAAPIEEAPSPVDKDNSPQGGNGRTTWADEDYGAGEQPLGAPTATYIYRTATGVPFMRVVRTTDHQFPTDHWENGRWVKGWPTRPFVPYRLPELLAALPEVPVFVPEGEKDCERLAALGLIATCNSGGASKSKDPAKSKWWPELNQHFAGKQLVYVLEDNDEPGRLLGDAKINALTPIVLEVVRVRFLELRDGGDVSDWLDQLNPRTARATLRGTLRAGEKAQHDRQLCPGARLRHRSPGNGLAVERPHRTRLPGAPHRDSRRRQVPDPLRAGRSGHHRRHVARRMQRHSPGQRHHADRRGLP